MVNVTVSSIGVSNCPMDSSSAALVVSLLFSSTTIFFISPFSYLYVVFSGKTNVNCDSLSNSTLSKPVMTLSPSSFLRSIVPGTLKLVVNIS